MQGNVFPLLQSPSHLKPVQDVAHAAPPITMDFFSFTSEAGR